MKVNEFIKEFNDVKDDEISKREFLCHRKTTDYVLFEVKVDICEKILSATSHETTNGITIWHKRTAYEYIVFTQQLLGLYTDIEFTDDNFMAEFNELNKEGLIDELLSVIPEKEFNEFNFVKAMCEDDLESNERNIMTVLTNIEQIINSINNSNEANEVTT